ncbi:hypothetical protein H9L39_08319 [Fusarium oxysporum f. sp. albedinis]|nr:hypothetical protein H9L39_08319 [Fusarium oxysporum f. sp. albedinis]
MKNQRAGCGIEESDGKRKVGGKAVKFNLHLTHQAPQVNGRSSVDVDALALLHSLFLASASAVDNPCRYAYGGGA